MKLAYRSALLISLVTLGCGSGGDNQSAGGAQPVAAQSQQLPRRLWTLGPADDIYDVSPDGRYAAYIDWDTGNLMLRDLQTGRVRNLTNKGTYQESRDEAESALFSPDGKWVAYEWWNARDQRDELRVAASDGSEIRRLNVPAGYTVWPETWTPDGKYIVTLLDPCNGCADARPNESGRIHALVPLDKGEMRTLFKHENYRGSGWLNISPDGRFATHAPGPASDRRNRIELVEMSTGRVSTLFADSARPLPIGWIDARTLLFASERGGTQGIWSLTVENGRAVGKPRLIRGDLWNMTDMQRLRGNRLYYDAIAGDRDVMVAGFDPVTGQLLSQPVSLTQRPGLNYRTPVWSPDGRQVAFLISRPALPATIMVRAVDGGDARELRPEMTGLQQLSWLPDGKALMLVVNEAGRSSLYRYDLSTGTIKLEVKHANPVVKYSRDGRYMFYVPHPVGVPEPRQRLMRRDLTTGADVELARAPAGMNVRDFTLVLDGNTALLVVAGLPSHQSTPTEAWTLSLADGTTRRVAAAPDSTEWLRPLGPTPDGKAHLFIGGKFNEDHFSTLWRVPLEGGPPIRLADPPRMVRGPQSTASLISPDGRRLMFVTGDLKTELWSLDLPR